jgi:hypothetical protein
VQTTAIWGLCIQGWGWWMGSLLSLLWVVQGLSDFLFLTTSQQEVSFLSLKWSPAPSENYRACALLHRLLLGSQMNILLGLSGNGKIQAKSKSCSQHEKYRGG